MVQHFKEGLIEVGVVQGLKRANGWSWHLIGQFLIPQGGTGRYYLRLEGFFGCVWIHGLIMPESDNRCNYVVDRCLNAWASFERLLPWTVVCCVRWISGLPKNWREVRLSRGEGVDKLIWQTRAWQLWLLQTRLILYVCDHRMKYSRDIFIGGWVRYRHVGELYWGRRAAVVKTPLIYFNIYLED